VADEKKPPSSAPPKRAPSRDDLKKLPTARDYMDTAVPTLLPQMEISEAVDFLLQHRRTGAPVVDDDGELVGILTEFDCLRLMTTGADHDEATGVVADFMSTDVVTIEPGMDMFYVAGLFLRHHFRRLPVLYEGKLVGAITRFDVLRAISLHS